MRFFLIVVLNAGLLGSLGWWLRREWHQPTLRYWLVATLFLKLGVTLLSLHWLSEDSAYYQDSAWAMTKKLWTEPNTIVPTLAGEEFHETYRHLIYHGTSNTFFLIKLLAVLNLASPPSVGNLDSLWINAFYLTLFCFVGCWQLVRAIEQTFPGAPAGSVIIGFLLWPTVLYWTSGLTKESLLIGSGAWLLALVVRWYYGAGRPGAMAVVGGLLLALLFFKMRFFFAALLLGLLVALGIVRLAQRLTGGQPRWVQVVLLLIVLVGGTRVVGEVAPTLHFNKFSTELLYNYTDLRNRSQGRPHIEFPDFVPTAASMAVNAPLAIISTIGRPLPWETAKPLYVAAGLENLVLLALLGVAVVAGVQGQGGRLPFALALVLVLYCIALAALLGLSTPNLGTLSRYRAALLPFLVLLLLQNDYAARWLNRWFR